MKFVLLTLAVSACVFAKAETEKRPVKSGSGFAGAAQIDGKPVANQPNFITSMGDDEDNFGLKAAIEKYQTDLRNLGIDAMVRHNHLNLEGSQINPPKGDSGEDAPIELSKRSHVAFIAFRKEGEETTWASSVFLQQGCTGGFLIDANLIVWGVTGISCGFVLFKDDWCRGPISFDTRGFNVNSGGHRYDSGFRSVYIKCF